MEPGSTSPAPTSRTLLGEALLAFLAGVVFAGIAFWPLPLHLDGSVTKELADPLLQAWQVAWGGHAIAHQPLDYFQSNTFWPLRNSLAFSDALVGYAPAGLIGEGPAAALGRYNLLFLASYGVAVAGAYLLARELGLGRGASAVAGAAFAFAPWRLDQTAHLHVLASGGIPLTLFLLLRGYRRGSPRAVVAGWIVAAWQLSLGFTLGLPLAYMLALASVIAAVIWLRRGRPRVNRRLLGASVLGAAVFLLVAALLVQPYLAVLDDHPRAERTIADLELYSAPPRSFVVASETSTVWGGVTGGLRDSLPWASEQTLFPGLAVLLLAAAGVARAPWPRRLRLGLLVAVGAAALLSTGVRIADGWLGYRWLYEFAPGWQGIRTPGRLNTLTSLGLALLAAGGAHALVRGLRQGPRARVAWAVAPLLALVVAVEGSGFGFPVKTVPSAPRGQQGAPDPQLHLPVPVEADFRDFSAFFYMLWSTDGFPRIVNGTSGFVPRLNDDVRRITPGFPDARSVRWLRRLGVRTVVLHVRQARGTPWGDWRRQRPEPFGVSVRRRGDVLLYDLGGRSQTVAPARRHARR